jgi:uncharacterized lipoprotein YddW (UPF0748 family)
VLAFADQNQITDLLVQVRGRGDAYYNSHFEPRAENLPDDFDPLAYLLRKAAAYHLKIHAWINVCYVWGRDTKPLSPAHVVNQHPEWLIHPIAYDPSQDDSTLEGRRNSEGLYLSPLLPEVQTHLLNVVNDLLSQYKVDGLHLDYIRFPGYGFEFDASVRKVFKAKYALDPIEFRGAPAAFAERFGETGYEVFYSRWGQFLQNGLSDFVAQLSRKVKQQFPGIIISAAVKPELKRAHWQYYQAWDRWLREGWLDWAIPMNYEKDTAAFLRLVENMLNTVAAEKVVMGVALYNQTAQSAMEKTRLIQHLSRNGKPIKGIALFSYDQIESSPIMQRLYRETISNGRSGL